MDMPGTAASAQAVVGAILGAGARIVMASFSGPGAGLHDGTAIWRAGQTAGPSWLDIDFVPQGPGQAVSITLLSEDVQVITAAVERGLIGIWVNGRELPTDAPPAQDQSPAPLTQTSPAAAPIEVTLRLWLSLVPGELASLRIGLDDLGGIGPVTMLAQSGGPGIPVATAAPAKGTPPMARNAVAGIAAGAGIAIGAGAAEAAPGNGNNGNGNGNGNNSGAGTAGTGTNNPNGQGAVARPDAYQMTPNSSITVDLRTNDNTANLSSLSIVGINGVAVSAGQTVTLLSGQTVTLNADKTVTIATNGNTGTFVFTYTVATGQGNGTWSTSTVTLNVIPCFVAGTRIQTPSGEVAVEHLRPGDLVQTLDDGPQPLRWIGVRRVAATGDLAPVHLRAGALGDHRTLMVSPLHRVLIGGPHCALLFGEDEVLAAARDLVDGRSVTRRQGGEVTYAHLMFDRHQIVLSEGLPSESYFPGSQTQALFTPGQVAEISALFPHVDMATGRGYGPTARRTLRRHEALAWRAGVLPGRHRTGYTPELWQDCA